MYLGLISSGGCLLCNRALYTWAQLARVRPLLGGPSALGMSVLLHRLYLFGVVELCTLGLNWGVHLYWVCLYFSIGYTCLV